MLIKPSKVIGTNYLMRWHLLPKNPIFNIYLHRYTGSDDARAMHDHPWWSVSIKLKGELIEVRPECQQECGTLPYLFPLPALDESPVKRIHVRSAEYTHRLILASPTAWTLFITGPRLRTWGFRCNNGNWVPWWKMTTPEGKPIDGGCDE